MLPKPYICMYIYNLYFLYTIIHLHYKNVDDISFFSMYENHSALSYLPYFAAQFYIFCIQKFYRKQQIVVFNTGTGTCICNLAIHYIKGDNSLRELNMLQSVSWEYIPVHVCLYSNAYLEIIPVHIYICNK